MANENIKVIEKHYIEVTGSLRKKFLMGLLQGLGWGLGVTIGTAAFIVILGYIASRVNWVPIVGQYIENVLTSTQQIPTQKR